MRRKKKIPLIFTLVGAPLLVIVLMVALVVIYFPQMLFGPLPSLEFNSQRWKNDESSWTVIRLQMIDNLLEQYSLVGLSRAEIIELLGEPDATDYSSGLPAHQLIWNLGPEVGVLSIELDAHGVVTGTRVVSE